MNQQGCYQACVTEAAPADKKSLLSKKIKGFTL
jgi:hypothetical protein